MNKKTIVILSVVVVIGCAMFILFTFLNKNDTVSIESVDTTSSDSKQNITITNRDQYQKEIDSSYDADIKKTLVTYLRLSVKSVPENTTGLIRANTPSTTHGSYGDTTRFIVDFPNLKISYKVIYSNDSSGYRATYVSCLDKNERIYPEIKCVDDVDE